MGILILATAGSSPRVRGTLVGAEDCLAIGRFIPACAGNAKVTTADVLENHGSSPRVRGTPIRARRPSYLPRFIPACAGNAQEEQLRWKKLSVHPRVCGERRCECGAEHDRDGSSPRVRGTRVNLLKPDFWRRFIPACAGNAR